MDVLLVTVPELRNQLELFIADHFDRFPQPDDLAFSIVADPFQYGQYGVDSSQVGSTETAAAFDPRGLPEHRGEPVRILFPTGFFNCSASEKDGCLQHEIGHLVTNPDLLQIRRFLSKSDPQKLAVSGGTQADRNIADRHNRALANVFYFLKIPQDVHAELWVYENAPSLCEERLLSYRDADRRNVRTLQRLTGISELRATYRPIELFIYDAPEIVWKTVWKEMILRNVDFSFVSEYQSELIHLWRYCQDVAGLAGVASHSLIESLGDLRQAIQYPFVDADPLVKVYERVFPEFIRTSCLFFPSSARQSILRLYELG